MNYFWVVLLSFLGFILLFSTLIYFKIKKKKPKDKQKGKAHSDEKEKDDKKDGHGHKDDHGHGHSGGGFFKEVATLAVTLAIICACILFCWWVITTVFTGPEPQKADWVVAKVIEVNLSENYGDIIYIEDVENLSFEGATVPYCIKNLIQEECSYGLEDIGPRLIAGVHNKELQLKSQKGSGTIKIVFWILK